MVSELERMATRDGLTALANRRHFDIQLQASLRRAKDAGGMVSLLLLDVDYFKPFNDTYGHPAGDRILKTIASTLKACCRKHTDMVARYGGEEFAVIMQDATPGLAEQAANRMRNAVRNLNIAHKASPLGRVTISIGVATLEGYLALTEAELLEKCDAALYAAKCAGRDSIETTILDARDRPEHRQLARTA